VRERCAKTQTTTTSDKSGSCAGNPLRAGVQQKKSAKKRKKKAIEPRGTEPKTFRKNGQTKGVSTEINCPRDGRETRRWTLVKKERCSKTFKRGMNSSQRTLLNKFQGTTTSAE